MYHSLIDVIIIPTCFGQIHTPVVMSIFKLWYISIVFFEGDLVVFITVLEALRYVEKYCEDPGGILWFY